MVKKTVFTLLFLSIFSGQAQLADSANIRLLLQTIIETDKPRNYLEVPTLDSVADFISTYFAKSADSVRFQAYEVNGKVYKNVIASFGTENENRIVVGAHYDVCGAQPGADDNASGTVGLLELSRLLKGQKLNKRIDLVAYTLEEPPFFRSVNMGSYRHAKYLKENNISVEGMVCLEMIGYFNEARKTQDYPVRALKLVYGSKGDYITVVRKTNPGYFARKFDNAMKREKYIRTRSFQAPSGLPGIDFSDHLNYWNFGFSAVMVTNTGFYRNKNYHKSTDKLNTLNIPKMTAVIQEVYAALISMSTSNGKK